MKSKNWHSYAISHQLVNRIYDMLVYCNFFNEHNNSQKYLKNQIYNNINDIYYVEDLAKYFEEKLRKNKNNIEFRCSVIDLIYDLNNFKVYLNSESSRR